eukprot:15812796-Heterocapsa_arctica.AAC.1
MANAGGGFTWTVRSYKQGREMNMAASGLADVSTFIITISGGSPRQVAANLVESMEAIEGSTGPGNAVYAWGPDDWAEA